MAINMSCPACGKTLAAPDSAAGKRAKCPTCGQIMLVPGSAGGDAGPPPDPSGAPPPGAEANAGPPAAGQEDWLSGLGNSSPPVNTEAGGEARRPCPECGEMIVATAARCRFCGAVFDPRLRSTSAGSYQGPSHNGMAVASMVLGITSIPGSCLWGLGSILAIVGLVLGLVALNGMKKSGNNEGKGMAIAGVVLGGVMIGLMVCGLLFLVVMFSTGQFH